ncbi:MAG: tetratricopeptide repeat protein [Saprospiraceae bacterium]|nr:tetratricopeptide repeat protein [Saprospiraceae bacterium]
MSKYNKNTQKQKPVAQPTPVKANTAKTVQNGEKSGNNWGIWVVLAITFVIFYTCVNNQFVNWDDEDNFIKNPFLKSFDFESIKNIFTQTILGNYNPLPIFTFAIERALAGSLNPKLMHFDNILLHLICTFFAYKILIELKLSKTASLIGALLFGIHPMRVESVAWVTERKDVLFGAFFLPAVWLYIKDTLAEKRTRSVLIFILFILALFSKIQAVSLPLTFLAIDYYFGRPLKFNLITEKLHYFLASLLIGSIGIYFLGQNNSLSETQTNFNILDRLFIGNYSYFNYILKFIFPYQMSPLYPYPGSLSIEFYLSAILLIPFGYLCYKWYKNDNKALLFGVLFFTFNVMFLLQILGAGQGFLADRFTYIPYLGLFFLIGYLYDWVAKNHASKLSILNIGLGIYLVVFAFMSNVQCKVWENGETLWTHVLKYYQNATTPWQNLGQYYRENKMYDKALPNINKALSLKPSTSLYNSRGKIYFDSNKRDLAIQDYDAGINLGDKNPKTLGEVYVNRGAALASIGQLDKAILDFNKGLELDPTQLNGYSNRGLYHFQTRQYEKAISDQTNYLKMNPLNYEMYYERAISKAALGKYQEAIQDFDIALANVKNKPFFYYERGRSHQALGNSAAAQRDFDTAKSLGFTPPAN